MALNQLYNVFSYGWKIIHSNKDGISHTSNINTQNSITKIKDVCSLILWVSVNKLCVHFFVFKLEFDVVNRE
jgi:hypothetical protein